MCWIPFLGRFCVSENQISDTRCSGQIARLEATFCWGSFIQSWAIEIFFLLRFSFFIQWCNQSIFTSIYVFFIAQFVHFGRNVIFTAVHFTDTGREHLIRHPYHSSSADGDLGSWRSREKWVYLKTRDWAFHTGIHWNSDVRIHFFRQIAICTGIVHV